MVLECLQLIVCVTGMLLCVKRKPFQHPIATAFIAFTDGIDKSSFDEFPEIPSTAMGTNCKNSWKVVQQSQTSVRRRLSEAESKPSEEKESYTQLVKMEMLEMWR